MVYPGAFLGLSLYVAAPMMREWRIQNWKGPEWYLALKEAWADFNVQTWVNEKTGGKLEDYRQAQMQNRSWEIRWQALEAEMINRYQREYNVVKKLETDELNALNEKKTNLKKEQYLQRFLNSKEVVQDDQHREEIRNLAKLELQARKARFERWVPFSGKVSGWIEAFASRWG